MYKGGKQYMMKKHKSGITLASLVIYVVLFTTFTIFAAVVSSNTNEKLFNNRGEAINYSNLNKLQYNINESSLKSNSVSVTDTEINYSNGDTYTYDYRQNVIYKNGGVLCLNVENLEISIEEGVNTQKVILNISFSKYLNVMNKTIISCVEGV